MFKFGQDAIVLDGGERFECELYSVVGGDGYGEGEGVILGVRGENESNVF